MLDAGSSHTNLYVYEWPAEKENDTGVVQQVEVCKVEAWRKVTETLQVGWMKRGCEIEAGAGQGKLKRNANLE